MAMNFPDTPTVGQVWPSPAVVGTPVYKWDGTVWSSLGAQPGKMPVYTDGSSPMTAQLTLVGNPVNPNDAVNKTYSDLHLLMAGGQTITGGFNVVPYSIGAISSGTLTPNPLNGNYQYLTNSGAFTLAAPASDCGIDLLVTNGSTAGAITFAPGNWTVGSNTGDALTTTNTSRFIISIRRVNAVATYVIKALQ
jgi:hypothetical protein